MAKRQFTTEEMAKLKSSRYVLSVTHNVVFFTAEFKEKVWKLITSGMTASKAVAKLGIDPHLLGKTRI